MKLLIHTLRWLFWTGFTAAVLVSGAIGYYLYELSLDLPQNLEEELHKRNDLLPTVLYDQEGRQVGEFFIQRRIPIPYEEFPPHLIQALLASEDTRYFSHFGIDPFRILMALVANIQAGGIVQGASTLTQQTARMFLLNRQKHIDRKLREMLLSFRMEMEYSKEQILELYLNKYFMGNAEGVEAASQGYFGKHAHDLTVAESALLVGMLPAPSRYAPHINPDLALSRRNLVLRRMREESYLSEQEFIAALNEPIKLTRADDPTSEATAYYIEHVRRELLERYGLEKLYQGGLQVRLAMDLDQQIAAHEAMQNGLLDLTKRQGYRVSEEKLEWPQGGSPDPEALENILGKNRILLNSIVRAVVLEVSDEQALLALGEEQQAELPWESVKTWRKAREGEEYPASIRTISEVVSVGDIVSVKLTDFDSEVGRFRADLYQKPLVNGGLLAMNPRNGLVSAMIGGYRFENSEFNRAIQAKRQPGSAFKPIVYAAALDAGYTAASTLVDSPRAYKTGSFTIGDEEIWLPKNYGNKLLGNVSLRTSLVKSLNLPTIGLVEDLSPKTVINYARRLGVTSAMYPNLTVGLGAFSMTLQEMVNSYMVFADRGLHKDPVYIIEVRDQDGTLLEQAEPREIPVISEETAFLVTDILQDVVQEGTGRRARAIGRPSAGKTGTTNDYVDAWYIGYIPQLLTGVYVGYDQPRPMGPSETGSRAAAPIWIEFMKSAISSLPTEQFSQPPGVVTVKIHQSGRRATPCDSESEVREEHFKTGTQPPLDLALMGCRGTTLASEGGNSSQTQVPAEAEPEL
jgi:penicillin-binding protein 1A